MEPGGSDFGIDCTREDGRFLIALRGELDIATVDRVRRAVREREDAGTLVLDFGELTFLDTSGLQLVVELDRAAREDGFALSIRPGPKAVQRVFDIAGLTAVLPFAEDDDAGPRAA